MRLMKLEPRQCEIDLLTKKMIENEPARAVNKGKIKC